MYLFSVYLSWQAKLESVTKAYGHDYMSESDFQKSIVRDLTSYGIQHYKDHPNGFAIEWSDVCRNETELRLVLNVHYGNMTGWIDAVTVVTRTS